jgi:hypothetical protein
MCVCSVDQAWNRDERSHVEHFGAGGNGTISAADASDSISLDHDDAVFHRRPLIVLPRKTEARSRATCDAPVISPGKTASNASTAAPPRRM